MVNKEVYFEIILPRSAFMNYRLGVTKIVTGEETTLEAWDKACEEAEQWHKKRHPELYKHGETTLTVEETELVQEIEQAKESKHLGMLKNRLTKATTPYYMEKLKTLTNNFSNKE